MAKILEKVAFQEFGNSLCSPQKPPINIFKATYLSMCFSVHYSLHYFHILSLLWCSNIFKIFLIVSFKSEWYEKPIPNSIPMQKTEKRTKERILSLSCKQGNLSQKMSKLFTSFLVVFLKISKAFHFPIIFYT